MQRAGKFLILVGLSLRLGSARCDTLPVSICPCFGGKPVVYDLLTNTTPGGQKISFTRLDFLLSNFALRRLDGSWWTATNGFAFVNGREGKTSFAVSDIPTNAYDRVRFQIGLEPKINHGNVAQWPATHPLNPQRNDLYWGWSGGFVFLALEGHWQKEEGGRGGFSFHLGNDAQLMTVELPVILPQKFTDGLKINFALDKLFPASHLLSDQNNSTHSRTNDPVARQLADAVERAFTANYGQKSLPVATGEKSKASSAFLMAAHATPYQLSISAFFPQPNLPRDNPLTEPGVALGKKLFFEQKLSGDQSQSCASCHQPANGFSDTKALSRFNGEASAAHRNTMPLFNLAWKTVFFWDGRAETLRTQVLQPIQNPLEMAADLPEVLKQLSNDERYPALFNAAFGSPEISSDRLARALEQFLYSLVSYDSKFDRVIAGREEFTATERRGFELFHTEYDPAHQQFGADCFHCHGGPLFQSQTFANNGLDEKFKDAGRSLVTHLAGDEGKFAVPSLRNVELTGPYMHDGRFKTLEETVAHYVTGVKRSPTLDPNLNKHPGGGVPLSQADQAALVAFLKTLTDRAFAPAAAQSPNDGPPIRHFAAE